MGCDDPSSFSDQRRIAWFALSPISIVGCVICLYYYFQWQVIRRPPCRFLHFRFMNELVYSSGLLFAAIFEYNAKHNIFFWTAITISQAGMVFWTVNTLLDVVIISRDPFNAYRYNNRFLWVTWSLIAGLTAFMFIRWSHEQGSDNESSSCNANDVADTVRYPILVISGIGLALSSAIMIAISMRLWDGLPLSEMSRNRVMKQQVLLTVGFGISDLLIIIPDALSGSDYDDDFWVDYIIPIRCILDVLIFCIVNKIYSRLCSHTLDTTVDTAGSPKSVSDVFSFSIDGDEHDFATDMRHELVILTALGISHCAKRTHDNEVVREKDLRESIDLRGKDQSQKSSVSSSVELTVMDHDHPVNKSQRSLTGPIRGNDHVMSPDALPTMGSPMGHSAPRLGQKKLPIQLGDKRETCPSGSSHEGLRRMSTFSGIEQEQRNTYFAFIKNSVTEQITKEVFLEAGFTEQDFDNLDTDKNGVLSREELLLDASWHHEDMQAHATRSSTGGRRPIIKIPNTGRFLDFYDYESRIFETIRYTLGISAEAYSAAFDSISEFNQKMFESGDSATSRLQDAQLKEIVSSGASGSYFYFTPTKEFIVKQVSRTEKENLLSIARSYMQHCFDTPATTIHYYGLHSIRLPFNTKKTYFVVMKNFLHTEPELGLNMTHCTFDLKGATTNRRRFYKGPNLDAVAAGGKGSSLLDWDWMDLKFRLNVQPDVRERLAAVLRKDLIFLANMQLLDYSILLGYTQDCRLTGKDQQAQAARAEGFDVIDKSEPSQDAPLMKELELQDRTGELSNESLLTRIEQPLTHFETGEPAFCLGMIDILEKFDCHWKTQGCLLYSLTSLIPASINATWSNPEGITAIHPEQYAWRFDEFMQDQVLAVKYKNEKWRPHKRWGNPWK